MVRPKFVYYLGFGIVFTVLGTVHCLTLRFTKGEPDYYRFVSGNVNTYGSHRSPTYELTLLIQLVLFCLLLSSHAGISAIMIGFHIHVSAQFQILKSYIDRMIVSPNSRLQGKNDVRVRHRPLV